MLVIIKHPAAWLMALRGAFIFNKVGFSADSSRSICDYAMNQVCGQSRAHHRTLQQSYHKGAEVLPY